MMEIGEELDAAIEARDERFLSNIFGFAEWCIRCTGKQLNHLIIAFFYKIVFMSRSEDADYLLQWVSPYVYEKIEWYLGTKLGDSSLRKAREIIKDSKHEAYRKNWYYTVYAKQV